jgi:hypothetical protein
MSINRFIKSFTYMPKEIFRLNNGRTVRLRAHPAPIRPHGLFDLLTVDGKVRPLALNPAKYECTFQIDTDGQIRDGCLIWLING